MARSLFSSFKSEPNQKQGFGAYVFGLVARVLALSFLGGNEMALSQETPPPGQEGITQGAPFAPGKDNSIWNITYNGQKGTLEGVFIELQLLPSGGVRTLFRLEDGRIRGVPLLSLDPAERQLVVSQHYRDPAVRLWTVEGSEQPIIARLKTQSTEAGTVTLQLVEGTELKNFSISQLSQEDQQYLLRAPQSSGTELKPGAVSENRTWTSNAGTTVTAKLVGFDSKDGMVVLEREGGRQISLALSQLSAADQKYIRDNSPKEELDKVDLATTERLWTSISTSTFFGRIGRFSPESEDISLVSTSGREISCHLSQLSMADQELIRRWHKANGQVQTATVSLEGRPITDSKDAVKETSVVMDAIDFVQRTFGGPTRKDKTAFVQLDPDFLPPTSKSGLVYVTRGHGSGIFVYDSKQSTNPLMEATNHLMEVWDDGSPSLVTNPRTMAVLYSGSTPKKIAVACTPSISETGVRLFVPGSTTRGKQTLPVKEFKTITHAGELPLGQPVGVAYHGNQLLVTDKALDAIFVFNAKEEYQKTLGQGILERPELLAVRSDGVMAVSQEDGRVRILTPGGSLLAEIPAKTLKEEEERRGIVELFHCFHLNFLRDGSLLIMRHDHEPSLYDIPSADNRLEQD